MAELQGKIIETSPSSTSIEVVNIPENCTIEDLSGISSVIS